MIQPLFFIGSSKIYSIINKTPIIKLTKAKAVGVSRWLLATASAAPIPSLALKSSAIITIFQLIPRAETKMETNKKKMRKI